MLNLNEKARKVEAHTGHAFVCNCEKEVVWEYWRKYGLDLLNEKNPTYSQCKAAAIGNQTGNPELAADLMVKAKKWRKKNGR